MSKNRDLYILVRDEDRKIFAVAGPVGIESSNEWLDKGAAAVKEGRRVAVFDLFENFLKVGIQESLHRGFTQVPPEAIVEPPKDRSAEYAGTLPKYAERADRDRVIQILCKGRCMAQKWAELNQIYPGEQALKKANMGTFTARCLRCGTVARDNYNWHR